MMAMWRVELKDETGFESQYYEDKVWKTYVSYGHGETAHSKAVEMVDTMNKHGVSSQQYTEAYPNG